MIIKRRTPKYPPIPTLDVPEYLQRIYANRGVTQPEELDTQMASMLNFESMMGMPAACDRLEQALVGGQRILVIGDFDADGATSTALACSALKSMGASEITYLVPNRFEFGYGLTPGIVEVAAKWKPDLLITVDNGISSNSGVDAANERGIDVVITDHHLPGEDLPNAIAIVNPNQTGCGFPSKSIAGVGVIFYVMAALRRHLTDKGWFKAQDIPPLNMASLLDLVALGTVADVVGLDKNNRIMVNQGLARIRQGQCRPGIKALIEISGKNIANIREKDLGFSLAPRLNAAGRLDDMSLGIECLLADSEERAQTLACQLNELNLERRKIEGEMKQEAFAVLNKLQLQESDLPLGLCLYHETWHQGVIGILAGRLKEQYHRPVVVFAKVNNDELKGSARSVEGINIRDVFANMDKDDPALITKFGGHAMAAGLTIPPKHLDQFKDRFNKQISEILDPSMCQGEILTLGPLMPEDFVLETAEILQKAGPWGQQFPAPVFDNVFEIMDQRIVGQNHLKMLLKPEGGEKPIDAIAFHVDLDKWPNHRLSKVHAAYQLDINEYQGRRKPQLMVDFLTEPVE